MPMFTLDTRLATPYTPSRIQSGAVPARCRRMPRRPAAAASANMPKVPSGVFTSTVYGKYHHQPSFEVRPAAKATRSRVVAQA